MNEYTLVKNDQSYWEFIRETRNNQSVKAGFIQQEEITEEQQARYMSDKGKHYWICLERDKPVGYVGVIDNDIRVATHPDHQGKGVGVFMITKIIEKFPEAYAKIKLNNQASIGLFEKCGFVKKYYLLERSEC